MKKLVALIIGGSLVVGGIVFAQTRNAMTPEGKACIKLAEVCTDGDTHVATASKDLDKCVAEMKQMRKLVGDAGADRSLQCLADSSSCMNAAGCLVGGAGVGAVGEMLKGLGSSMSK